MEIEPTPVGENLARIYGNLPSDILAVEEARIRGALSELAGQLLAIENVKETSNEYPISA